MYFLPILQWTTSQDFLRECPLLHEPCLQQSPWRHTEAGVAKETGGAKGQKAQRIQTTWKTLGSVVVLSWA